MARYVIFSVCVFLLCSGATLTQDDVTSVPDIPEEQYEERPIDASMDPIYTMTNFFLEKVLDPPSLQDLHDKVNLTDSDAVVESLTDWKMWLKHFSAYVACLVVGVVYAIALPIIGCSLCGCRSRGRCGGKQGPMDNKNTKHKRRGCAIILVMFCIALLFGVTCLFLSNALIYEQTESRGLPGILHNSVTRLQNFVHVAADSLKMTIYDVIDVDLQYLLNEFTNIAELCQSEVGRLTNCGPLLEDIEAYVLQLNKTHEALSGIDDTVNDINDATGVLEEDLTRFKNNITNDFSLCAGCDVITNLANQLAVNVDFSGLVNGTSQTANDLGSAMNGAENVYDGLRQAQQEFDSKVGQTIRTEANTESLKDEAKRLRGEVDKFLNESLSFLDTISFDQPLSYVNETFSPMIEKIGRYRYYGGLATGSLVLLVTVLCCFGVLFGVCGVRKGQPSQCCHKGTAHKVLWASIIFIFIFAWLLMLITAVLLPIGGIPHNDICVHLLVKDRLRVGDVIDQVVTSYVDLPFSFADVFNRCGRDESLYSAFQLAERHPDLNLSSLLNPNKYDILADLQSLNSSTYNPGSVILNNTALVNGADAVSQVTDQIDLSSHLTQLNKPIITGSLDDLVAQLGILAHNGSAEAKEVAGTYISVVNGVKDNAYQAMKGHIDQLAGQVSTVEILLQNHSLTTVLDALGPAQDLVTPAALSQAMSTITDNLYQNFLDLLSNAVSSLGTQAATCTPVSDAANEIIHGACVRFLHPFNAYWFSLGWCLFFFLLIIPAVVVLGSTYRKTQQYEPDTASFEDPSLLGLDDGITRGRSDPYRLPRVVTPNSSIAGVPYDRFQNGRSGERVDSTWDNPAYTQDDGQVPYIDGYREDRGKLPRPQLSPDARQQDFRW